MCQVQWEWTSGLLWMPPGPEARLFVQPDSVHLFINELANDIRLKCSDAVCRQSCSVIINSQGATESAELTVWVLTKTWSEGQYRQDPKNGVSQMVFLSSRENWYLGEWKIEIVGKYKYLGFNFSTMLSYDIGTEDFVSQARRVQ